MDDSSKSYLRVRKVHDIGRVQCLYETMEEYYNGDFWQAFDDAYSSLQWPAEQKLDYLHTLSLYVLGTWPAERWDPAPYVAAKRQLGPCKSQIPMIQRKAAIARLEQGTATILQVAVEFGVGRQDIYEWQKLIKDTKRINEARKKGKI